VKGETEITGMKRKEGTKKGRKRGEKKTIMLPYNHNDVSLTGARAKLGGLSREGKGTEKGRGGKSPTPLER